MKSGLELLALFPVPRYLGKVARAERQLLSIYFSHDPLTLAMFHPVGGRRGTSRRNSESRGNLYENILPCSGEIRESIIAFLFFFFFQTIPTRRYLDANHDSDQNMTSLKYNFEKLSFDSVSI